MSSETVPPAAISDTPDRWKCAEDNRWTPIVPTQIAADDDVEKVYKHIRTVDLKTDDLILPLKAVAPAAATHAEATGKIVFHTTGCTGDPDIPKPQDAVAADMAAQLRMPDSSAFFYHLGDIAYKSPAHEKDEDTDGQEHQGKLLRRFFHREFYAAYAGYDAPIFAIAGNHDGKYKDDNFTDPNPEKSPMWHFLGNFCARKSGILFSDNQDAQNGTADPNRTAQIQPYPYFVLDTPAVVLIGLYANVINGGCLDDPAKFPDGDGPQYHWLVRSLRAFRERQDRALILAVHYPPYSAAADFRERGDAAHCPKTQGVRPANQLATVLERAFTEAVSWPDLILSAHAHLYQRLTYTRANDGRQIPCLIIGSGGHADTETQLPEAMNALCNDSVSQIEILPESPAVLPEGYALTTGDSIVLNAYNDQDFGFVRITCDTHAQLLTGEYFAVYPLTPPARTGSYVRPRHDAFRLDLHSHKLI